MATQAVSEPLVSLEEYLSTGYQPDCEYNDGVVEERNLGELDHSYLQAMLITLFMNNAREWGVFVFSEQRLQVRSLRFLVPDVTMLRETATRERILTRPPLITVEIMSPQDRLRAVAAKSLEYLDFGVENIWVIDPSTRTAYVGTETGLERVASMMLNVARTTIEVDVRALFERLDEMWAGSEAGPGAS